jgi:cysteinyl-tRNA synthetase
MKNLKISNTLNRIKELFKPINSKRVTMYACGPTVYDDPHVGNARSLVVFDLLFRILRKVYGDNSVTYVRNITDIDDKIIDIAKDKNLPIDKITKEVTKQFHSACKSLNCLEPTVEPKATEHVDEMIKMTDSLIKKGFAYVNKGHVYFSISSFKNYGKLSNKNLDELKAGSRIEVSSLKKNPLDFVLWKPSEEKDPGWNSPWGRGRPGWHLECSIMSEKYLGKNFDIHGGGLDLVFPHHENEIAQSCCNNSVEKMANYWVHNGFLTMNEEKMSKSLKNIVSINNAVKQYGGQSVRLALLSSHYKQPLDWNDKLLKEQKNTLNKWYNMYEKKSDIKKTPDCFEYLLDDLNTPGYISKLHELYNEAAKGDKDRKKSFNDACHLIGIFNETKEDWEKSKKKPLKISEEFILNKIKQRLEARKNGNFELADKIRKELSNEGVLIEDKKDKTDWKYK